MAEQSGWRLDRQISIGVIVAVVLQAGGALLWAGQAAARIDQLEDRVEAQGPLAERLARLEEQASAARAALERIETKLERVHGR